MIGVSLNKFAYFLKEAFRFHARQFSSEIGDRSLFRNNKHAFRQPMRHSPNALASAPEHDFEAINDANQVGHAKSYVLYRAHGSLGAESGDRERL